MDITDLEAWISAIVAVITTAGSIWFYFARRRQRKRNANDLHPFFSNRDASYLRKHYIKTRLLTFTPSNFEELIQVHNSISRKNSVSFKSFFKEIRNKSNSNRFYFILGESGLGKTTFLMTLFLKYNKRRRSPYKIKLVALGNPYAIDEIKKLVADAHQIILCIDGFDELTINEKNREGLEELFDLVWTFRIVLISCRTQFFDSKESEPVLTKLPNSAATGFLPYRKFYVAPFNVKEVKKYLRKKYWFFQFGKRRRALRIVTSAMNLMIRPFLLKNIGFLMRNRSIIKKAKYSLAIYAFLIDQWIERDVERLSDESLRMKYKSTVPQLLRDLAICSYKKGISTNNYYLTPAEVSELSGKYDIDIEFIKVRSLLNRDEAGNVKFSHKSVLEYFLAIEAIENPDFSFAIRNNGAFDVANAFLDEHYFIHKVTPIIQNSLGYYYEVNKERAIPLAQMNILAMYSVAGLYFTDFTPLPHLKDILYLKRLREVVFFIKWENLNLFDIYHACFCSWRDCVRIVNGFIPHAVDKKRFPVPWAYYYESIFTNHTRNFFPWSINEFFQEEFRDMEIPAYVFIRLHDDPHYTDRDEDFKFEISDNDIPIEIFLKKLYNYKCLNIVSQLAELTTSRLRTLLGTRASIVPYREMSREDAKYIDDLCERLAGLDEKILKGLDNQIAIFRANNFPSESSIRIYS